MNDNFGIYIHIPYCKSKCPYCDFYSKRAGKAEYADYANILIDKIKYHGKMLKKRASSIYIGGGTPSVMGEDLLCGIVRAAFDSFTPEKDCEVTVEVNPESAKSFDFSRLKSVGVNRISVGLQSADKRELSLLGRLHSADDAKTVCENAIKSGIDNISLDLMLGIPSQTIESLKKSIDFCLSCSVRHISSYILKIEENTVFDRIQSRLDLPDDDEQARMYLFAVDCLSSLGFSQYEISNFAIPGYESRHNINYWRCGEYIGIGPSAHSFVGGKRFYYPESKEAFLNDVVVFDCEGGGEEEFIMLSLRLKSGLNFDEFERRYNKKPPKSLMSKINLYAKNGFMEISDKSVCFTPKGFLVSNSILSEII